MEATDIGWFLTISILAMVQWAGFQPANDPAFTHKFEEFAYLKPSEMGDTLAGIFAALAFVWIIVTVAMQSTELSEQRKEFEKMAGAQEQQVDLLVAQGEIFILEQRQRDQYAAGAVLEQVFEGLAYEIDYESRAGNLLGYGRLSSQLTLFHGRDGQDLDTFIRNASNSVHEFWMIHNGDYLDGDFEGWIGHYERIQTLLERVFELEPRLGDDDKQRIENLNLGAFLDQMRSFTRMSLWGDYSHIRPEFEP